MKRETLIKANKVYANLEVVQNETKKLERAIKETNDNQITGLFNIQVHNLGSTPTKLRFTPDELSKIGKVMLGIYTERLETVAKEFEDIKDE